MERARRWGPSKCNAESSGVLLESGAVGNGYILRTQYGNFQLHFGFSSSSLETNLCLLIPVGLLDILEMRYPACCLLHMVLNIVGRPSCLPH